MTVRGIATMQAVTLPFVAHLRYYLVGLVVSYSRETVQALTLPVHQHKVQLVQQCNDDPPSVIVILTLRYTLDLILLIWWRLRSW
jgi:hypothetical protein